MSTSRQIYDIIDEHIAVGSAAIAPMRCLSICLALDPEARFEFYASWGDPWVRVHFKDNSKIIFGLAGEEIQS